MYKIVSVLCIILFAGCQNSGKNCNVTEGKKLLIPSQSAITIEDLIADYDTIRLEASNHSLLSGILLVRTMNNKLYITDNTLSIVFIYSMQGKYLSKICNQGEGPEEYIKISSFETDPANNRLLLTDSFSKRLFEYDENGKLQQVISLDFSPTSIVSDISKRYIHLNSGGKDQYSDQRMESNNVHIVNNRGKVVDTFLKDETPKRLDIRSASAASYAESGELLYMPLLSDTIYRIHQSEAIPEYIFDNQTGLKTLSEKDKETLYYKYGDNNIEEMEQKRYLLTCGGFLHSDSLIFLDMGWNIPLYTYYSKKHKSAITINPDELRGNKGLCAIFSTHPKVITGKSFYINIAPEQIQYALPLLPESKLKTFFEAMTENDNPCIIVYRLNEDLFTDKN